MLPTPLSSRRFRGFGRRVLTDLRFCYATNVPTASEAREPQT